MQASCTYTRAMTPAQIEAFFTTLQADNPAPRSELEYSTPFELLVAVLLSAQATDVGVNKATRRLFAVANTPQAILALGQEGLESYIKTIGLYRSKARHLLETCRILVERYGGEVPRTREALEALPGVGRKTANVILNVAFGEPTIAVDTHIFRVCNRTGLAPGKTPLEVERKLLERVPENTCSTRTTGSCCSAATSARRASRAAGNARSRAGATTRPSRRRRSALGRKGLAPRCSGNFCHRPPSARGHVRVARSACENRRPLAHPLPTLLEVRFLEFQPPGPIWASRHCKPHPTFKISERTTHGRRTHQPDRQHLERARRAHRGFTEVSLTSMPSSNV